MPVRDKRTYDSWREMMHRCHDSTDPSYANYGGRGITVAAEWHTFAGFLASMGSRPVGMTLDRECNDLGYSRENCRWASRKVQVRNRRNTWLVEFCGEKLPVAALAERFGIDYYVVKARLKLGWSIHRALSEPLSERHSHKKSGSGVCLNAI